MSREICDLEQVHQALDTPSLHQETVESITAGGILTSHGIVCVCIGLENCIGKGRREHSQDIQTKDCEGVLPQSIINGCKILMVVGRMHAERLVGKGEASQRFSPHVKILEF